MWFRHLICIDEACARLRLAAKRSLVREIVRRDPDVDCDCFSRFGFNSFSPHQVAGGVRHFQLIGSRRNLFQTESTVR